MDEYPFLSVIIVTYNRKNTFEKAIRSVFSQDYPAARYEIIVVDDGSTDGTRDMVKTLSAEHTIRYFSQPHKSIAAVRNVGVKNARGEIICFLDSDCIAPKEWLSTMVKTYQMHPEVVSVGGWWKHILPHGMIFTNLPALLFYDGPVREEGYIECLATRNLSYKKDLFSTYGFFDEELGELEDRDFNLRFTSKGLKMYFLPQLVVEHIHPFNLVWHYKREFHLGRFSYRLHLRWGRIFMPGYRLPLNAVDTIIFWTSPFFKPWLTLKEYGLSMRNIICMPFLTLKYFVYRVGIYYEMKKLRKNREDERWKSPLKI